MEFKEYLKKYCENNDNIFAKKWWTGKIIYVCGMSAKKKTLLDLENGVLIYEGEKQNV